MTVSTETKSTFNYNRTHLEGLFGNHSDEINFGYCETPKVTIAIKGKRKVKLIAKAWLCDHKGYKWFAVTLATFERNEIGLKLLIEFVDNAEPQKALKLVQVGGK